MRKATILAPMFRSSEFVRLTRMLCSGQIREVQQVLAQAPAVSDVEKRELEHQANFQAGKLIVAPATSTLKLMAWTLLVEFRPLAIVFEAVCQLLLGLVRRFDFNGRLFMHLHARWYPEIIHLRYVNFEIGLVHSLVLFRLCPHWLRIDAAYLEGIVGHFWGMSGRFDVSRRWLQRSSAKLSDLVGDRMAGADQEFYAWHLKIEIQAIHALHMAYSGQQIAAQAEFGRALTQMEARPYIWFEIFARTMRQYSSLDMLNDDLMHADSIALKQRLGDLFISKYALRTSAYAGLLAAIKGDFRTAYLQLLNADSFYSKTPIKVELGRYHCIRALTELELGDAGSAIAHARKARAFYANIPGGRFHRADSLVFDSEVRIRSFLQGNGGLPSKEEVRSLRKALATAKRLVKGSEGIVTRIDALTLILGFISGDLCEDLPVMNSVRERLSRCSPRLGRVMAQVDHGSLTSAPAGTNHRNKVAAELSLNMIRDVLGVFDAEDPKLGGLEIFQSLFGAESAELSMTSLAGDVGVSGINFGEFVQELPSGDVLIVIQLQREKLCYRLFRPLNRLQFDSYILHAVELSSRLIQSIIMARESTVNAAVASTTQMLAHDIRRPFAMLNMALGMLESSDNLGSVKAVLANLRPEVKRSIASVESLLSDVLEIGADAKIRTEDVSPVWLIKTSLADTFRLQAGSQTALTYSIMHQRNVAVESQKVLRILSNILQNASQASGVAGNLHIATADVSDGGDWVTFRIENSGLPIPNGDLPHLFEPFFTKGKRAGTGLGMAIAKKFVLNHGGQIWCENCQGGVAFTFRLPAAPSLDTVKREELFSNSGAFALELVGQLRIDQFAPVAHY